MDYGKKIKLYFYMKKSSNALQSVDAHWIFAETSGKFLRDFGIVESSEVIWT